MILQICETFVFFNFCRIERSMFDEETSSLNVMQYKYKCSTLFYLFCFPTNWIFYVFFFFFLEDRKRSKEEKNRETERDWLRLFNWENLYYTGSVCCVYGWLIYFIYCLLYVKLFENISHFHCNIKHIALTECAWYRRLFFVSKNQ